MKNLIIIILIISAISFTQELGGYDIEVTVSGDGKETNISRHRAMGLASFGLMKNFERVTDNDMKIFDIPAMRYELEWNPKDILKFYGYADAGFRLDRVALEGEVPEGEDTYRKFLYMDIDPSLRAMSEKYYFVKLGIPFRFSSATPQIEDASSYSSSSMEAAFSFGFDNREIYIHEFSPWDRFEKGWFAELKYTAGIFECVDSDCYDELTNNIIINASFAKLVNKYHLMLKPYTILDMELNDKRADHIWFTGGLFGAWDYKMDLNTNGYFAVKYGQFDRDNEGDAWGTETFIEGGLVANYYLFEELRIFIGSEFSKLLFADQDKNDSDGRVQFDSPEILFEVGLEYTYIIPAF